MTTFQKVIKYGAIAFAIYLAIVIIGIIIGAITAIFGITIGIESYQNSLKEPQVITKQWEEDYSNIKNLDIDLSVCKLEIKKGDTLKIETADITEQFECRANGDTLKIKDNKLKVNWFQNQNLVPQVIVYIPDNIVFDKIDIETGVNDTNIDYLKADKIELETGVGKCNIQNFDTDYARIECGAGETIINDSTIETLKLDSGIGRLVVTSKITNNADVDSGVGEVELNLKGNESDYKIKAQKGLGSFTVDGKGVSDDETIGNGNAVIKIDAGVGKTTVNFKE